ncbi:MAG: hypothetical protein JW860_02540 [Sedimentisphaerales bacterium]|nr:hypothetical protein [Sedimentisphaerales bacterium]
MNDKHNNMLSSFFYRLSESYKGFDRNHDQLRLQVLASLPEAPWEADNLTAASYRKISSSIFSQTKLHFAFKTSLATAAVLLIGFGLVFFIQTGAVNPQKVWAAAKENVAQVQSVHFTMSTPSSNNKTQLEMWWRRNGDYRMVIGTTVFTGNQDKCCIYNQDSNTLTIRDADKRGPEMAILGQLGSLFDNNTALPNGHNDNSKILNSEKALYKGEQCFKMVSEFEGDRFEYYLDMKDSFIYQVDRYSPTGKLLSHVEVLDMNKNIPDDLFEVDPSGKLVIDQRN